MWDRSPVPGRVVWRAAAVVGLRAAEKGGEVERKEREVVELEVVWREGVEMGRKKCRRKIWVCWVAPLCCPLHREREREREVLLCWRWWCVVLGWNNVVVFDC